MNGWEFLSKSINSEVRLLLHFSFKSTVLRPGLSLAPVRFHSTLTDPGSAFVFTSQKDERLFGFSLSSA